MTRLIDVAEVIDRQPMGSFQVKIAALGAAVVYLDGFDNQAMGYVAPAVTAALHLKNGALGPVFSAGLIGFALGALLVGPFGDWIGRKKLLVISILAFSLLTLIIARASSVGEFMALRFLIGTGLGAGVPLTTVLVTEFAPRARRATLVTLMLCGYSIGAASGGLLAAKLIPHWGWPSVFYVGGSVPIVVAIAVWRWMPESARLLMVNGATKQEMMRILRLLDPTLAQGDDVLLTMPQAQGSKAARVGRIFSDGRWPTTALLWLALFVNGTVLTYLNSWLPTLLGNEGIAGAHALRVATALQFGGLLGVVSMGVLTDRFGAYRVLSSVFLAGGIAVGLIGAVGTTLLWLVAVIFASGFAAAGLQMNLAALAANLYPTEIRATGTSSAMGVSRFLSSVGPFAGGIMMSWNWSAPLMYAVVAVPMFAGALFVVMLARIQQTRRRLYEVA